MAKDAKIRVSQHIYERFRRYVFQKHDGKLHGKIKEEAELALQKHMDPERLVVDR